MKRYHVFSGDYEYDSPQPAMEMYVGSFYTYMEALDESPISAGWVDILWINDDGDLELYFITR
jgi:hypothetical protein